MYGHAVRRMAIHVGRDISPFRFLTRASLTPHSLNCLGAIIPNLSKRNEQPHDTFNAYAFFIQFA